MPQLHCTVQDAPPGRHACRGWPPHPPPDTCLQATSSIASLLTSRLYPTPLCALIKDSALQVRLFCSLQQPAGQLQIAAQQADELRCICDTIGTGAPNLQQSSPPVLWGSMIMARAFLRWVMLRSRCWPLPSRPSHSRPCLRLAISGTYTISRHPAEVSHRFKATAAHTSAASA